MHECKVRLIPVGSETYTSHFAITIRWAITLSAILI
nr:MAG TPA: hypothetical protein [Caudoviricetes sp.]